MEGLFAVDDQYDTSHQILSKSAQMAISWLMMLTIMHLLCCRCRPAAALTGLLLAWLRCDETAYTARRSMEWSMEDGRLCMAEHYPSTNRSKLVYEAI